jgi:CRP-like cAMP-binding protein
MTDSGFLNGRQMFERYSNSFLRDFNLDNLLLKFKRILFKSFTKGEFIYRENERVDFVYFILSGEVSIGNFSDDSGVCRISKCSSGDVIGFDEAISGLRHTKSAFAVSNVNAIEIKKSEFIDLTKRNDEFNLWILKYLSDKINLLG